jgi:RNA polymerase sigma factor (sigma-70 family)
MERLTTRRTDGELMARSERDAECFGAVFDRHFAGIHRYLARRAGREVADELAVETFVVAFRRRHTYRVGCEDARPWLFGIAANLLRDEWRREQRQLRAWERAAAAEERGADGEGLLDRVDAQAAARVVGAALASLGAGDRETLTLFAWAEMSYEEIAEALAIPVGTVRSRMHRARKQVRAILTAHALGDVTVVGQREAR